MFTSKKHRKRLQIIWGFVTFLIVISMILLYFPALFQ